MSGCIACPIAPAFRVFTIGRSVSRSPVPRWIINSDGIRPSLGNHQRAPKYERKADRFMNPAPCPLTGQSNNNLWQEWKTSA
ncbi:hypothetical protein SAMN05216228_100952 [Rhizobium tibeticum]|uniref:Uncharacterized protein n=1 Tax=Rhizobium tibeticum TaxID=501024 RepID=A0ABY1AKS2_9HYPH|nr:hypothetical protein SAMN05216228_100952 [Rhizobium tibeticum]